MKIRYLGALLSAYDLLSGPFSHLDKNVRTRCTGLPSPKYVADVAQVLTILTGQQASGTGAVSGRYLQICI